MSKTKLSKKGFTIVELLVVIVVIGILAAITVVSYTGVTDKANTKANLSNAGGVISAAEAVRAESTTSAYPVASATESAMLTALNASVAKVPTGIKVTGQVSGSTTYGTLPTNTTAASKNILYVTNTAGTGICVYYYDHENSRVSSVTSGSGGAATTPPTTAAAATCS